MSNVESAKRLTAASASGFATDGEDADRVERKRAVELQEGPAALDLELDAVGVGGSRRSSQTIDSSSTVRVIDVKRLAGPGGQGGLAGRRQIA